MTAPLQSGQDGDALLSPTVGVWRAKISPGALLSPGLVIGEIRRASRWVPVRAHAGARGQAAGIAPDWAAVQYGDALVEIGAVEVAAGEGEVTERSSAEGSPLRATMSGTLYLRPSPDQPAFAPAGAAVSADETVALLEVMKTFTPVKAGSAGTIQRWLVADGEAVEADQIVAWLREG